MCTAYTLRMQIKEKKRTHCHFAFTFCSHCQNPYPNRFNKYSRLLSRYRVLPFHHLWQALFITLDPTNTIPPSCRTKSAEVNSNICGTLLYGSIILTESLQWQAQFKFRTLCVCLTAIHSVSQWFLKWKLQLWRRKKKTITHLLRRTEAVLSFFSLVRHWHRYQGTKQTRPSEASLPVLWENCNDSWQLDKI